MTEEQLALLYLLPNFIAYYFIAREIIVEAIAYRPEAPTFFFGLFDIIKLTLVISSICWMYFIGVYTVLFVGYFLHLETIINVDNFRDYTRILGIPMVVSTGYLIHRLIRKIRKMKLELLETRKALKQAEDLATLLLETKNVSESV